MDFQRTLQINKVSFSILIFIAAISAIHLIQPAIVYNPDGSFKQFGIGYRNKTVIPIWVVCIILGIFSYLVVCWGARVGR